MSHDLEHGIVGLWAIHPSWTTAFGRERFRGRPRSHIEIRSVGWRLYETSLRHRFRYAGTSEGLWRVVALDEQRALLMLIVRSYRQSRMAEAVLGSNYGYSGGAMIVGGAKSQREGEMQKMRDGEARMYFMPVLVRPQEIIVALPSNGRVTPRQRWMRL